VIDGTYLPDVAKAIVVKSNSYTTWHISAGGPFLHLKVIHSMSATTSQLAQAYYSSALSRR